MYGIVLPSVRDDYVVEGGVLLAEAGKPYAEDHGFRVDDGVSAFSGEASRRSCDGCVRSEKFGPEYCRDSWKGT